MYSVKGITNPFGTTLQTSTFQDCFTWKHAVKANPPKELHQKFPGLLTSIFGFGGTSGWNLSGVSKKIQQTEFWEAFQFLAPSGQLFQLIAQLEEQGFLYEFPITCIPRTSQQQIAEGRIPPFYEGKIKPSLSSSQEVPNHIYLTAFEFYVFHFAYYLVHLQAASERHVSLWANLPDSLYTELLEAYLKYFLPCHGMVPPPVTVGLGNVQHVHVGADRTKRVSSIPTLQVHGSSVQSPSAWQSVLTGDQKLHPSPSLSGGHIEVQSEVFVQTLAEFWLNYNKHEAGRGSILARSRRPESFSQEHVRLVRMMVKHVLYFTNGHVQLHSTPSASPYSSTVAAVTETLRSSVLQVYVQRKLYCFIKHAFQHWPLNDTFRYVVELWLTYIQPWRYTDMSKTSKDSMSQSEVQNRWRGYVMDNLPFYTTLLIEFLIRSFQLRLISEIGAMVLFRFSKVFAQPGLMDFISEGEALLLYSDASTASMYNRASTQIVSSLRALFVDLDGIDFHYQSLFDPNTIASIQSLLSGVRQAKAHISDLQSKESGARTEPGSPPAPAPSKQVQEQSWRSWFREVMQTGFPDTPTTRMIPNADTPPTDLKKVHTFLCSAEDNIRVMFKFPGGRSFVKPSPPTDASPVLHKLASPADEGSNQGLLTPKSSLISAEYEPGSHKLTLRGKHQVVTGTRVCINQKISPWKDPELQPVRSYENAMLVRKLHQASNYLNVKFQPSLRYIGTNQNLLCRLAMQLLIPPPPRYGGQALPSQTNAVETPVSRTSEVNQVVPEDQRTPPLYPQITLRVFASYHTLFYLAMLLILVYLLSVPYFLVVLFVLLLTLFFCVIRVVTSGQATHTG